MAVPKRKRYSEVVKTRRSLQLRQKILKKNLTITKFNSYASILTVPNSINKVYCNNCYNNAFINENKLCPSCYVMYFLYSFGKRRKIGNIKMKKRRYRRKFFYELSKTFLSPSRP